MSLKNKTIKKIINDCDFYNDHIELPHYFNKWTNKPFKSYNDDKQKCWQLQTAKSLNSNKKRFFDNVYNYKTNREKSGNIKEYMNGDIIYYNYTNIFIYLLIFICIVFIIFKYNK